MVFLASSFGKTIVTKHGYIKCPNIDREVEAGGRGSKWLSLHMLVCCVAT